MTHINAITKIIEALDTALLHLQDIETPFAPLAITECKEALTAARALRDAVPDELSNALRSYEVGLTCFREERDTLIQGAKILAEATGKG